MESTTMPVIRLVSVSIWSWTPRGGVARDGDSRRRAEHARRRVALLPLALDDDVVRAGIEPLDRELAAQVGGGVRTGGGIPGADLDGVAMHR